MFWLKEMRQKSKWGLTFAAEAQFSPTNRTDSSSIIISGAEVLQNLCRTSAEPPDLKLQLLSAAVALAGSVSNAADVSKKLSPEPQLVLAFSWTLSPVKEPGFGSIVLEPDWSLKRSLQIWTKSLQILHTIQFNFYKNKELTWSGSDPNQTRPMNFTRPSLIEGNLHVETCNSILKMIFVLFHHKLNSFFIVMSFVKLCFDGNNNKKILHANRQVKKCKSWL